MLQQSRYLFTLKLTFFQTLIGFSFLTVQKKDFPAISSLDTAAYAVMRKPDGP